jgi:hypothetical protein
MDVFLACGAAAADAPTAYARATRLQECSAVVALVPWTVPERNPFPGGPLTLSLGRLLTLEKSRLRLDVGKIAEAFGKRRPKRVQAVVPFPTPPGTTWEQVTIEFANDEHVKVVAGNIEDHRSFAEIGFADRRKVADTPDRLWELLVALAEREGRASFDDPSSPLMAPSDDMKRRFSDLRQRLQAYFGIQEDPLEPYAHVNGYQTRFVLRWSDGYRRSRAR